MNHVLSGDIEGIVVETPVVQFTQNGKSFVNLLVRNTKSWVAQGQTKTRDAVIQLSSFGDSVDKVSLLREGDHVFIVYEPFCSTWSDKTGGLRYNVSLSIQSVARVVPLERAPEPGTIETESGGVPF